MKILNIKKKHLINFTSVKLSFDWPWWLKNKWWFSRKEKNYIFHLFWSPSSFSSYLLILPRLISVLSHFNPSFLFYKLVLGFFIVSWKCHQFKRAKKIVGKFFYLFSINNLRPDLSVIAYSSMLSNWILEKLTEVTKVKSKFWYIYCETKETDEQKKNLFQ